MTLTEVKDLKEIVGLCGIYLFGMLKDGKFATPWVEAEVGSINALRVSFNKAFNKIRHHSNSVVGQAYKDAEGNHRLYCCAMVEKDGEYTKDQLMALKMAITDDPIRPRMYPLMDTFGSLFDLMFPEHPSDQPGGIFIAGELPEEVKKNVSDIFNGTMFDIFVEAPSIVPSVAKLFMHTDETGKMKFYADSTTTTTEEKTDEQSIGDHASQ